MSCIVIQQWSCLDVSFKSELGNFVRSLIECAEGNLSTRASSGVVIRQRVTIPSGTLVPLEPPPPPPGDCDALADVAWGTKGVHHQKPLTGDISRINALLNSFFLLQGSKE